MNPPKSNPLSDALAQRFKNRQTDEGSRATRRRNGQRGALYGRVNNEPVVARYIRRHFHKIAPVDFTIRSARPARRERKMQARINRLALKRGIV